MKKILAIELNCSFCYFRSHKYYKDTFIIYNTLNHKTPKTSMYFIYHFEKVQKENKNEKNKKD